MLVWHMKAQTVEEVLSHYIEAVGGVRSFRAIQTKMIEVVSENLDHKERQIDREKRFSSQVKREVVESLAKELNEKYVFPDLGGALAKTLMDNLNQGLYETVANQKHFAEMLTRDLRSVCNDQHIHVVYGIRSLDNSNRQIYTKAQLEAHDNWGYLKLEVFPGGIGYLKLDRMTSGDHASMVASSAMNFLSGSRALVLDLRENPGGAAWMVQYICSYLFDESTLLYSIYHRLSDETREVWTLGDIQGERFGTLRPVFVLVSHKTFSAAEGLAYTLKHLKRATIVGETTRGGAHPRMRVDVSNGFEISIPIMRVINPITDTDWEGVGVKPDIYAPSNRALDTALKLARLQTSQKVPF